MTTELKEMLAKATPGPWTLRDDGTIGSEHGEIGVIDVPDGPLIVHLRNHAEDYLAAVEALELFQASYLAGYPAGAVMASEAYSAAHFALARLREQGADR